MRIIRIWVEPNSIVQNRLVRGTILPTYKIIET